MLEKINNNDMYSAVPTGWVVLSESKATFHQISFTYKTYHLKGVLTFFSTLTGEREEVQMVCAGKEFRLPVYSTSRTVTFTPDSEEPRRVLLEKTTVSEVVLLLVFLFVARTDFQNLFTLQL